MALRVSIIVVAFDMKREIVRTIASLLPPYQLAVTNGDVEIIVVDNNSAEPVRRDWFPADGPVRVVRVEDGGVSPCIAINRGARLARADYLAVLIDGARLASPGLLSTALAASRVHPRSFVATMSFHLGQKKQQVSLTEGYTREVEDGLLNSIGWPENGYRLFEICTLGEGRDATAHGVLKMRAETNFCFMRTSDFMEMGGFNERFIQLGGGFANFDFFRRAAEAAREGFVMLVGEGTFHQVHCGATTQAGGVDRKYDGNLSLWDLYGREYEHIVGQAFTVTTQTPALFGRVTHSEVPRLFFGKYSENEELCSRV
ncbi:MAG: glycosyltransferase family A protein [Planctomycetota bacterium]